VPIVLKSGSLNLLEPSGSVQACTAIALPLFLRGTHISLTWYPYHSYSRGTNISLTHVVPISHSRGTHITLTHVVLVSHSLTWYPHLTHSRGTHISLTHVVPISHSLTWYPYLTHSRGTHISLTNAVKTCFHANNIQIYIPYLKIHTLTPLQNQWCLKIKLLFTVKNIRNW
jgi:hypothetical protein